MQAYVNPNVIYGEEIVMTPLVFNDDINRAMKNCFGDPKFIFGRRTNTTIPHVNGDFSSIWDEIGMSNGEKDRIKHLYMEYYRCLAVQQNENKIVEDNATKSLDDNQCTDNRRHLLNRYIDYDYEAYIVNDLIDTLKHIINDAIEAEYNKIKIDAKNVKNLWMDGLKKRIPQSIFMKLSTDAKCKKHISDAIYNFTRMYKCWYTLHGCRKINRFINMYFSDERIRGDMQVHYRKMISAELNWIKDSIGYRPSYYREERSALSREFDEKCKHYISSDKCHDIINAGTHLDRFYPYSYALSSEMLDRSHIYSFALSISEKEYILTDTVHFHTSWNETLAERFGKIIMMKTGKIFRERKVEKFENIEDGFSF